MENSKELWKGVKTKFFNNAGMIMEVRNSPLPYDQTFPHTSKWPLYADNIEVEVWTDGGVFTLLYASRSYLETIQMMRPSFAN